MDLMEMDPFAVAWGPRDAEEEQEESEQQWYGSVSVDEGLSVSGALNVLTLQATLPADASRRRAAHRSHGPAVRDSSAFDKST